MIRINLLPFRAARKKENVRQQVSIFLLFIVLLVISLGFYYNHLSKKIKALQEQIEYTQKEIQHYKVIAQEVEELKRKVLILKRKLKVIDDLDANRDSAFTLLDTMTRMVITKVGMPDNQEKIEKRLWLIRIETLEERPRPVQKKPRGQGGQGTASPEQEAAVPQKEVRIKISGIALDEKTIADFMLKLQESGQFKEVALVAAEQHKIRQSGGREEINLKRFEVACKRIPKEKPSTSKDKTSSPPKEKQPQETVREQSS